MKRFDRNEVIAALAMMAFGMIWLLIGQGYAMGNSVRIGAGVFPVALSIILIALCGVLVLQARGAEHRPFGFQLRPMALVLGGILFWALTVDVIGFLPATIVLVASCALAERASTWRSTLLLTAGLCAFGYGVFIEGLNIPLSVIGG